MAETLARGTSHRCPRTSSRRACLPSRSWPRSPRASAPCCGASTCRHGRCSRSRPRRQRRRPFRGHFTKSAPPGLPRVRRAPRGLCARARALRGRGLSRAHAWQRDVQRGEHEARAARGPRLEPRTGRLRPPDSHPQAARVRLRHDLARGHVGVGRGRGVQVLVSRRQDPPTPTEIRARRSRVASAEADW